MANRDNPSGFSWVGRVGSSDPTPVTEVGVLAASQTIAVGDALTKSSGAISIAASNSGAIEGVCTKAVTDSTAGDSIEYIPATIDNVFEAQCSGTYAESMRGAVVDIEGATSVMEVNENATTEGVFQIIRPAQKDSNAVGANTRVQGIFVRSTFQTVLAAQ